MSAHQASDAWTFLQGPAERLRDSVEAALQHADCILVTEEHIVASGFPLGGFCCLVRYVHEASLERGSQVLEVLQQAPCPR